MGEITEANHHLGIVGKVWGPNWTAALAVQGNSINSSDVTPVVQHLDVECGRSVIQYVGRVTFAPILTDTDKLHRPCGSASVTPASRWPSPTRPAPTPISPRFTSTGARSAIATPPGALSSPTSTTASLQAEYASVDVTVRSGPAPPRRKNGTIPVGYIYATWWPTGEMRNHDPTKGEFRTSSTRLRSMLSPAAWAGLTDAL